MEGGTVADADTRDYRETMIDWIEQIHDELSAVRLMVQIMFIIWLISLAVAILGLVVVAQS